VDGGTLKESQNGLRPERAGFGHKKVLVTTDVTRPFKVERKGVDQGDDRIEADPAIALKGAAVSQLDRKSRSTPTDHLGY
jgi:hypothetical protein